MGRAVLFSIVFYAMALIYSAVAIPLLALFVALWRPFCGQRKAMKLFRLCIKAYARGIISVLALPGVRLRVQKHAGPGEREPFVYVCNHRSASDAFLTALFPGEGVHVVNKWPFRLPVLGPLARWAGYLSVREMAFDEFKAKVVRLLEEGVSIVAFPEGTRSGSREVGQFHGAVFRACMAAGSTIAPVCIMGNEDKPRRGSLLLHPGEVHVHRLPGVGPDQYEEMTAFALKNHVRGLIENHIEKTEGTGDGSRA
jgi:1-acyl-sn-glycerol-3-phosphate acyltransferase